MKIEQINSSDKPAFEAFCASTGLTASEAIHLFDTAVLREPDDPFYNPCNQAYVPKSVNELRSGKGKAHELTEAEEK